MIMLLSRFVAMMAIVFFIGMAVFLSVPALSYGQGGTWARQVHITSEPYETHGIVVEYTEPGGGDTCPTPCRSITQKTTQSNPLFIYYTRQVQHNGSWFRLLSVTGCSGQDETPDGRIRCRVPYEPNVARTDVIGIYTPCPECGSTAPPPGGSGGGTTPPGGGGGTGSYTLQINSDESGIIIFGGGVNCRTDGSGNCVPRTFTAGTSVTFTAPLRSGVGGYTDNVFQSWTGCDTPVNNTCTVVMNGNKTVTANYGPPTADPLTPCLAEGNSCVRSTDCKLIAGGEVGQAPGFGGCAAQGVGQVCCATTFAGDACAVGGNSGTCRLASACTTLNPGVAQGVCNDGNGLNSNFVCCYDPPSTDYGPPLDSNPRDAEAHTITIVPCGIKTLVRPFGQGADGGVQYFDECTICHLQILAMNLLAFLMMIGLVFAALLFANAGILYATASASAANIAKAHKLFIGTLIGLVLVLVAYALIDVMMKMLLAGDEGNVNNFGPWNTILCAGGPITKYTVPGINPVSNTVTAGSGSVPLPETCSGFSGTCYAGDPLLGAIECPAGQSNKGQLNCGTNSLCCTPPASGNSCTTAGGASGRCIAPSACQSGTSEPVDECGGAGSSLECCVSNPPVVGTGLCSVDNLRRYGLFPENQLQTASCVCQGESSGVATAPSGTDKCQPTGFSASYGLFQINLTAHTISGLPCPTKGAGPMYTSRNKNCSIIDAAVWEKCKDAAKNPDINIRKAYEIFRKSGWGQWGAYKNCR